MLRVQLSVVNQRLGLSLRGRARGGGVLLGAFEQLGTGLLGGSKHLLSVGAERRERVALRLLIALLLQLGLQLQNAIIIRGNLLSHVGQRAMGLVHAILGNLECRVHLLFVVSSQHHRETVHHVCPSFHIRNLARPQAL